MQKKLLLLVTTLALMSFEQTMFSASLSAPAVEAAGATLLSNDFAQVKQLIDQGKYTSQELNWALVSATCNNNPEIVQLLLDFNQAQDEKILKRSTVDAARAIAFFCNLTEIRGIFNSNKLFWKFSPPVGLVYDQCTSCDDMCWALMAAAYIGHVQTVKVLMDIVVSREFNNDENNKLVSRVGIGYFILIAQVRNNIALQEILMQFAESLGFKGENALAAARTCLNLEVFLNEEGQLDQSDIQCLEDMEYNSNGITIDLQQLSFHEMFSEEYKRGNQDKIKKILNFDRIVQFFVNIGLIDASKMSLVTTSHDQEFITFMNDLIKNKLSLKK